MRRPSRSSRARSSSPRTAQLVLTGGEPTLDVELAGFVRACRAVGLSMCFDSRHAVPLCKFPERQALAELYAVGPPMQGHGWRG